MTYMTRQQQAVLDCIAACPGGCATAMVLADRLRSGGQSVGRTPVYRQLARLEITVMRQKAAAAQAGM